MKKMGKRHYGGYVTVYLSMLLGILLPVYLLLLDTARTQTCRLEAECAADMALDSTFAEYSRALLERYDLFFIDCSYGSGVPSWHRTQLHIKDYLQHNFHPEKESGLKTVTLTGLDTDSVLLTQAALATDEGGEVLRRQAVSYEKEMTGAAAVESLWNWATSLGDARELGAGREKEKEGAYEQMEEYRYQRRKLDDEKWEEAVLSTPADSVDTLPPSGLLKTVMGSNRLSTRAIPADSLVSHRTQNQGTGFAEGQKAAEGLAAKAFFTAYILEHFGCYREEKEGAACDCQIEYILKGKSSDRENLEAVCRDLFLIRYGINMGCLLQDGAKMTEAEEVAAVAAVLIWQPEAAEAIKTAILFGWGYAESVQDLRILFNGDRLPFFKQAGNWQISLWELPLYKSRLDAYTPSEEGNTYRDYLTAFLLLEDQKKQNQAVMDMIEADIRLTDGNAGFRLDGCMESLTAQIEVTGIHGKHFSLERKYRYE